MLQTPSQFLASFIPPEVRNHAKHKDIIDKNLVELNKAEFLTDSQQIAALYQRGLREDAGAAQSAQIQGIQNICSVFQGIGIETNNRDLANGAQLISAGTQLYSAYAAYSALTATATTATAAATTTGAAAASAGPGAALLGPIGLGAVALFSIYSTFKRKKDKSGNFPELLMQSLGVISQQVNQVNTNVLNGFEKTFEYHQITLALISDGFTKVNESQHALQYQTSNMHAGLTNDIKKLLWYIQSLGDSLLEGQETLSLQRFSGLIERSKNIFAGNIVNNPEAIQKTAYKLAEWSKFGGTASNPLYTGIKFVSKTRNRPSEFPEIYSVINKMINPINPYNIIEFQGLLAYLIKEHLNSGAARDVDIDALFNPDLWIQATYRYLKLRDENPHLVLDNDRSSITGIIQAADNQLAWEAEKRHSKPLYEAVFALNDNGIRKVQKLLIDQMTSTNKSINERFKIQYPNAAQVEIDIGIPLDELLQKFVGCFPADAICPGEPSIGYYAPHVLSPRGQIHLQRNLQAHPNMVVQINARLNQANGYAYLSKNGTDTPYPIPIDHPVLALAEHLGLIRLSGRQQVKFRRPVESADSGSTGTGPVSYISDDTYTLTALIDGTETIIQIDEVLSNTETKTKTLVKKGDVPNIAETLVKVRSMIVSFIYNQKKTAINQLMTDSDLNFKFKDEALASIDASIRLLSALMCHWPEEMQPIRLNALHNSSQISHFLRDSATYNKPWQKIIDEIIPEGYNDFKNILIQCTQNPDTYWKDDEYTLAIKELRQAAIQIRDKPVSPVSTVPTTTPVSTTPPAQGSQDLQLLNARISNLEQMMQVLMQQNMALMQEVQRNNQRGPTGSPSLMAYSSGSSSSTGPTSSSEPGAKNKMN